MTSATAKADAENRANIAAEYNWSQTLLNSDPELKSLFNKAVKGTWSPDRFIAELQTTKWYQKHSDSARAAVVLQTTDPATWKSRVAQSSASLQQSAAQMGAVLSTAQLSKMSTDMTTLGWTSQQQQAALSQYVRVAATGPNAGQYVGSAGQNTQALMATAEANGYKISDTDLAKWNQSISAGTSTVDDYQQFMRRQAALTFPSFSDELLAGSDMKDVANPYINSMSNILEIPSTNITLQDPTLRKALAGSDPKTGKPQAMAMYDFESTLRQDPRWQYTDNAKQAASGALIGIGRMMGKSI